MIWPPQSPALNPTDNLWDVGEDYIKFSVSPIISTRAWEKNINEILDGNKCDIA